MVLGYEFFRKLLYNYLEFQDLLQVRGCNKLLKKECIPYVARCFAPTNAMHATASIMQWILHEVIYENQRINNGEQQPFLFVRSAIACDKTDFVLQLPDSAIQVGHAWYTGDINPKNHKMLRFLAQHPVSILFKDSIQRFALQQAIPFLLDDYGPVDMINAGFGTLNWRMVHELKFQFPGICQVYHASFLTRLYCLLVRQVGTNRSTTWLDYLLTVALVPLICLNYASFVEVIWHILLRTSAVVLGVGFVRLAPKKIFRDLRVLLFAFVSVVCVFLYAAPYATIYILMYILYAVARAAFVIMCSRLLSRTQPWGCAVFVVLLFCVDYTVTTTWLI